MRSSDSLLQKSNYWLKMLSTVIISGCFIVAVSVMGRIYMPRFDNGQRHLGGNHQPQSPHTGSIRLWFMDSSIYVKKIQAVNGWSGNIRTESGGLSTGKLPEYMRRLIQVDSSDKDILPTLTPTIKSDEEPLFHSIIVFHSAESHTEDCLIIRREIVGFQPTSLLAVNNWASNPLTKELYGEKKLTWRPHKTSAYLLVTITTHHH
ncbi:hypothetical protein CTI12_AA449620 [Artemisia annua]|uniref:Uncharacterized protein n=1 Tax=Artemisia annua TaxID=35608 RepID=A0A2U1LVE9_ARTAN|nr:hypothetical protein CTI12_AA449620 [Artemisia annua]